MHSSLEKCTSNVAKNIYHFTHQFHLKWHEHAYLVEKTECSGLHPKKMNRKCNRRRRTKNRLDAFVQSIRFSGRQESRESKPTIRTKKKIDERVGPQLITHQRKKADTIRCFFFYLPSPTLMLIHISHTALDIRHDPNVCECAMVPLWKPNIIIVDGADETKVIKCATGNSVVRADCPNATQMTAFKLLHGLCRCTTTICWPRDCGC